MTVRLYLDCHLDHHLLPWPQVQKLGAARPRTLQEASEISGVTPAGLTALLVALREYDRRKAAMSHQALGAGIQAVMKVGTEGYDEAMPFDRGAEKRRRRALAKVAAVAESKE